MVGKKVEMVEKKVKVVGLGKEVEMVGLGHYRVIIYESNYYNLNRIIQKIIETRSFKKKISLKTFYF